MDDQTTNAAQDNTAAADVNAIAAPTTNETAQVGTNTSTDQNNQPQASAETVASNEPASTEPTTPQGAPENYEDFSFNEGFQVLPEVMDEFKNIAKEVNLSQEMAQKFVPIGEKLATVIQQKQQEQFSTQVEQWTNESKSKYGDAGIEAANKALCRFSTPEFKQFLTDSGLGNHPEMIGIFKNISDKISDGTFIDGTNSQKQKTAADLLFGTVD